MTIDADRIRSQEVDSYRDDETIARHLIDDEQDEAAERLLERSRYLNRVCWRIAEIAGAVPDGATSIDGGDTMAMLDKIAAKLAAGTDADGPSAEAGNAWEDLTAHENLLAASTSDTEPEARS